MPRGKIRSQSARTLAASAAAPEVFQDRPSYREKRTHLTLFRASACFGALSLLASTGCVTRPEYASPSQALPRLAELKKTRLIYIGERHDNASHHQFEQDVIRTLHEEGTSVTVGMEMLDVTRQADLNDYLQNRISWSEFARRTGFDWGWGTTSAAYRRIISWCARNGVPVLALNAPAIAARKLARGEPLTAEEKKFVPKSPEPPGGFEQFKRAMRSHQTDQALLRRYYQAQRAWDQTMAGRILAWLHDHSGTLVVLLGSFHADQHTGVPWYVAQQSPVQRLILFPGSRTQE